VIGEHLCIARPLVCVFLLLLVTPSVAHGAKTIRFYSWGGIAGLGPWNIGKNPRLGAAVRQFGTPDVRTRLYDGVGCRVVWRPLGLRILFVNFGGSDPCHGRSGFAQRMVIRGDGSRQWRTDRGLKIGMREARVPRLHPQAVQHRSGWWLTTYTNHIGPTRQVPGLVARTTNGRVSSFRAPIGAAGD
jgi:hypothetical protein